MATLFIWNLHQRLQNNKIIQNEWFWTSQCRKSDCTMLNKFKTTITSDMEEGADGLSWTEEIDADCEKKTDGVRLYLGLIFVLLDQQHCLRNGKKKEKVIILPFILYYLFQCIISLSIYFCFISLMLISFLLLFLSVRMCNCLRGWRYIYKSIYCMYAYKWKCLYNWH